jgi:hypothetical protein
MTRTKKRPTKSRRKVAAAPTLRQTLTETKTATRGRRLIDLAIRSSEKYNRPKPTWFDVFCETHPRLASEMLELVRDWVSNGPTRKALPRMSQLFSFCVDDCGVSVTVITFRRWVESLK